MFIVTGRYNEVSPPSRGAWIEIKKDRQKGVNIMSRPPRGGRGLKSVDMPIDRAVVVVAPLAGGVD